MGELALTGCRATALSGYLSALDVHRAVARTLVLRVVNTFTFGLLGELWPCTWPDALELRAGDRGRLDSLTRSSSVRAGLATRARIVLLAAEGVPNTEIAVRTGTTRPTVLKWRGRYGESGSTGCSMSLGPGVHR